MVYPLFILCYLIIVIELFEKMFYNIIVVKNIKCYITIYK